MPAALALLSCFSAWQAWRHNPLYASRSGLWLITKTLMMVLGAAALIAVTSMLTADGPATEQVGALVLCGLICTLGLVFGIGAMATPRVARQPMRLPPSVMVVRVHRRRVTGWLRIALGYFAACGLLAVAPEPVRSFARVLACLGGLISATMLPIGYVAARRMDRAVTALMLCPWLHWQYPQVVRDLWCKAQIERVKRKPPTCILRRDWLNLLGLCALMVIPTLALMSVSWIERAGWGVYCCVLLGLFIELAAAQERRAGARLARRLKAAPGDVWFGRDGLVCDGHFYTWIDTRVYLISARIDWRPPRSVCFVFANSGHSAYGAPTPSHVTQNVLIPPSGAAADLASLQQQLLSRCPNADIKLT